MMRASDLHGALRPVLALSILFGVWPRRQEASGWVKLLANASLCFVFATITLFLYAICVFDWEDFYQTEIITLISFMLLLILAATTNCASHIFRKDEVFSTVMKQIARVDSVLGVDHSKVYRYTKKMVCVTILAILVFYLLIFFIIVFGRSQVLLLFIYLDLNIVVTELQFVCLVLTLNHRFQTLNQNLETVFQDGQGKKSVISSIMLRGGSLSPQIVPAVDDETVRNLQKVHFTLTMLGRRVNRFYGLQNVANVVLQFLSVTYVIFDILVTMSADEDVVTVGTWAAYIMMLLMPTVKVVALAVACQKTETAAASTALLLSRRQLQHWKKHQTTDRTLEAFAGQVGNMSLKFDAWALFYIDGPLLRTVGATVVTYTIILLQFSVVEDQNEAGDQCNRTTANQHD